MQAPSFRTVLGCRLFSLLTLHKQPVNCSGVCSPLLLANKGILVQKLRCRYRLYPHPHRETTPARAFGWGRVVWNDALALGRHLYKQGENVLGGSERQKRCLTQARRSPERFWLAEVSNVPPAPSVGDLDQAFRSWWGCLKGKGRGKVRAPRFKTRSNGRSTGFTRHALQVEGHTLRLSKVGAIPVAGSREPPAEPSSVTMMKDRTERSFASFVVAKERESLPPNGNAVGIDSGRASLAVTRDGVKIAPLTVLRTAPGRLQRLQRSLSPKAKGASNRVTARLRRALAHAMVADQRLDLLHKLGTGPIRERQTVCIEDLNVAGMTKKQNLARSIADAGWRLPRTLLVSKARMDRPTVQAVSRRQPTCRTCSDCGHRDGKNDVSSHWWRCPASGAEQDRHGNAACPILAAALANRGNAGGAERKTSGLASGSEAGTHLDQGVQRWIA